MCLRHHWSMSEVSNLCMLFTVFMYAAMYDVNLSINVTRLEVASIWVVYSPLLMIPKLIQNPADQAQCKWLVLPQCTGGQWNPIPLCNIAPSVDDLKSPFYLVHGRDPLKGRLSNLQKYCRYIGDQPSWLAVEELREMWKLHVNLLEENRKTDLADNRKITNASDLKIGQLDFVKDHHKGTFDPTYIYNHRVSGILNEAQLCSPLLMEKRRSATSITSIQ